MSLRLDPSYAAALAPIAAMMGPTPKFAVGDVASRRAAFDVMMAAFNSEALPPDVEITKHKLSSFDGAEIEVWRFSPTTTREMKTVGEEKGGLGPALVHTHGGGFILGSVEQFSRGLAKVSTGAGRWCGWALGGVSVFPAC
jgi:acetyl esterase/lipase